MNNNKKGLSLRFLLPTCWRHGTGIVSEIGGILKEYGCKQPLIVTDKALVSLGVVEPVRHSLNNGGIAFTICDSVSSEPTVDMFDDISSRLDLKAFDSVIAVGGGSVIDVSKGLAVLGTFGGSITDYDGFDKFPAKPDMKIFAIPTTAGTGSEVADGVVIEESHINNIVRETLKSAQLGTNPRQPTEKDVEEVLHQIV